MGKTNLAEMAKRLEVVEQMLQVTEQGRVAAKEELQ